jgi:hypothetical protein
MKGNILFKPHEIALKSSISSFDVSLTDEIFLITDKGKLLRSNQFKKIDDVMIEFVDFLKAEDEKIQQIVCGDSFVGILTGETVCGCLFSLTFNPFFHLQNLVDCTQIYLKTMDIQLMSCKSSTNLKI